ncbi:MAG TPA: helix-turn-helix domain-containing protein [Victivallales bacterium]|nr:helix-turn-helix domain-containing protein [Victivallales bacterium]
MFKYREINKIRKANKIQQKKMAESIGVSRLTLYRWETGASTPSNSNIRIIAQFLKIPLSKISDLDDIEQTNSNIKTKSDISFKTNLYKLDKLIEEFGNVPVVKINAFKQLKQTCFEYQNMNMYLEKKIRRYEHILSENSSIIYVLGANNKYRYVNQAFIFMTSKYSLENIIGYRPMEIFRKEEVKDIIRYGRIAFKEHKPIYNKEINIPRSNGVKGGLLTIHPRIGKNEKIIEIICSIQDISGVSNFVNLK